MKIYVHIKTYAWMFIVALATIAKEVGTAQMSITWWVDKHNVVHSYNGILFGTKKEWHTDTYCNIEEP